MLESSGNFGTASQVSADDILKELKGSSNILSSLAANSTNRSSPYFVVATDELEARSIGGHQMKMSGKQPDDDDPESRKVIWGHTMIDNSEALINFIISHHLERFISVGLLDYGSKLAQQKDFLLNALIDVVLLDQTKGKRFAAIHDVWSRPKDNHGLGWSIIDRRASYGL